MDSNYESQHISYKYINCEEKEGDIYLPKIIFHLQYDNSNEIIAMLSKFYVDIRSIPASNT